jgi:hypothetical protein
VDARRNEDISKADPTNLNPARKAMAELHPSTVRGA